MPHWVCWTLWNVLELFDIRIFAVNDLESEWICCYFAIWFLECFWNILFEHITNYPLRCIAWQRMVENVRTLCQWLPNWRRTLEELTSFWRHSKREQEDISEVDGSGCRWMQTRNWWLPMDTMHFVPWKMVWLPFWRLMYGNTLIMWTRETTEERILRTSSRWSTGLKSMNDMRLLRNS